MRDFYHTGLGVSKSDLRMLLDHMNPAYKIFVKKGSGVASPVKGVYEAGSDTNDGRTWDTALASITEAIRRSNALINWSASPWAPNTEIHIAPGSYDENLTSMPYGGALIGHGDAFDADGERGVRIKPSSGAAIACTSIINCRMENLNIQVSDASKILEATNFNNNQVIHCSFQGPPEATTALCGMSLKISVANLIRDCQFYYMDCGIDWITGATSVRNWIDRNIFSFISEAGLRFHANAVVPTTHVVHNCIDGGSGTLAIGIDINMATPTVSCYRNNITASTGIEGDDLGSFIGGNYVNGVLE